ncbi:MAG: hypothetical protein VKM34_11205 [Cyanobacteriota bacterium]|nr:hypothetical protein [Cyanobacteriota bacterium]
MPPETGRRGAPVPLSAPDLIVVALMLVMLFATLVAAALWPVELLNPLWQLPMAGSCALHWWPPPWPPCN